MIFSTFVSVLHQQTGDKELQVMNACNGETHDDISTKDIKEIETGYIQKHVDKTGELPPGNQGHPGIKLPLQ